MNSRRSFLKCAFLTIAAAATAKVVAASEALGTKTEKQWVENPDYQNAEYEEIVYGTENFCAERYRGEFKWINVDHGSGPDRTGFFHGRYTFEDGQWKLVETVDGSLPVSQGRLS